MTLWLIANDMEEDFLDYDSWAPKPSIEFEKSNRLLRLWNWMYIYTILLVTQVCEPPQQTAIT